MQVKKSTFAVVKPGRNPLYLKIGKRIRQARLMAKETNSRELSQRLGWSAGRIHNYESGLSTPGIDETLQFCEALKVDPAWLTYGIGAPRAAELHSDRYRRFVDTLDQAERDGRLPEYLEAIKISFERMQQFRNNPFLKIPNVLARRCEKFLGQSRGWLDEPALGVPPGSLPGEDLQELLTLYQQLGKGDRKKLLLLGRVLLD
jgi:transcriptional regulator with XRE-family HTH domain